MSIPRTFGLFLALAAALLAVPRFACATSDDATTFLSNPTHNAVSSTPKLGTPLTKLWSVNLGATVSYPLIAQGMIFVTTAANSSSSNGYGNTLYALNAQTGATVWGPVSLSGTYSFGACAYEGGKVFVVNFDGLMRSFDAATGTPGWSVQLPGQYAFTSPPTALHGIVYVGGAGSGGTLYAVDERNGAVLWTQNVENGDVSSPVVTDTGVYVSYSGPQTYKFDPLSGNPLWHYSGAAEGGGGATAVLYGGQLYGRTFYQYNNVYYGGFVLNSDTGDFVKPFGIGYDSNPKPPAFDSGIGIFADSSGNVQAQDVASGTILWNFANGQDSVVTAPLIVNGNIYVGTSGGSLIALNEATGQSVWTGNVGTGITGFGEGNAITPSALAAGESLLVVPAGQTLVAYTVSSQAATPATLTLTPNPAAANALITGTLTLSAAAPAGGTRVSLVSSDPVSAAVPQSILVPAQQSTATFAVTPGTSLPPGLTHVTISATTGGITLAAPLAVYPPIRFDFDGDGKSDLLWHNTSTGQNLVWNMNDQSVLTYGASFATVSNTDWTIAAVADVNNDGHPDLLWQNTRTGQVLFWLMGGTSGTQVLSYGNPFATVSDTHWRVVSMADFNGDGHPDLLWDNSATGQLLIWYMNGVTVMKYGSAFTSIPNTAWQVVGTADFNGDGHPDLLWENSQTGQVLTWTMGGTDGTSVLNYGNAFATVSNTAWHVVGTGDINSDGHPDLIWENKTTGEVLRWLMDGADGTQVLQYGSDFSTISDTHWQIVGVH